MKPFNLEAALAGSPVCTRDGRVANDIKMLRDILSTSTYPIVAKIGTSLLSFTIDGEFVKNDVSNNDLFMSEAKLINTDSDNDRARPDNSFKLTPIDSTSDIDFCSKDIKLTPIEHNSDKYKYIPIKATIKSSYVDQELIICAAIRVNNAIFMGHRHNHAIEAMNDKLSYDLNRQLIAALKKEQGFITSRNRFVDRKEAWCIAEAANQIVKVTGSTGKLYSEDLY